VRALWDLLAKPGNSVLQVGPGSGHLLAAARRAGCSVTAVESGKAQRDFIRDVWNIGSVYRSVDDIPASRSFDVIVVDDLEHVYDAVAFLRTVRQLLGDGGTCYLSAANASSVEAAALRTWWPACKGSENVSFPSKAGLVAAAAESGLKPGRIWSTGLPLELPVSALTAARDRVLTARAAGWPAPSPDGVSTGRRAALANLYSVASLFDPGYRVLGALGRAGSLKATLTVRYMG
jgi:SAM-dependent methyltransferase